MISRLKVAVLRFYGRLPRGVRRRLIRAVAPSYTVGAACLVQREDGRLLLLQHSYRRRWGTPGGLLGRREEAAVAAVRETLEEIGLAIETVGSALVVVEPRLRRVDVVFRARPAPGATADDARPSSPEIVQVGWFALDELPELQEETAAMLEVAGLTAPSGTTGERRHGGAQSPR